MLDTQMPTKQNIEDGCVNKDHESCDSCCSCLTCLNDLLQSNDEEMAGLKTQLAASIPVSKITSQIEDLKIRYTYSGDPFAKRNLNAGIKALNDLLPNQPTR